MSWRPENPRTVKDAEHWITWARIRQAKVDMGLMSDREQRIEGAVDRYYTKRRDHGGSLAGRKDREVMEQARKDLAADLESIYPYREWLKRHD